MQTNFSVLGQYGEDLTAKQYITKPAIAREEEIKRLIMTLLTPEKSGLFFHNIGAGRWRAVLST